MMELCFYLVLSTTEEADYLIDMRNIGLYTYVNKHSYSEDVARICNPQSLDIFLRIENDEEERQAETGRK